MLIRASAIWGTTSDDATTAAGWLAAATTGWAAADARPATASLEILGEHLARVLVDRNQGGRKRGGNVEVGPVHAVGRGHENLVADDQRGAPDAVREGTPRRARRRFHDVEGRPVADNEPPEGMVEVSVAANGSLLPAGSGGITEWIKNEDLERMQSYAAFDDVTGLFPGDDVKLAGVPVGPVAQVVSVIASLVSLSWSLVSYLRILRMSLPNKQNMTWPGTIVASTQRVLGFPRTETENVAPPTSRVCTANCAGTPTINSDFYARRAPTRNSRFPDSHFAFARAVGVAE